MAAIQWAVFIVANHTRRQLLAESAAVRADWEPGNWDERSVSGTALAKHWDFNEDRMKVVGTVPVDDEAEALVPMDGGTRSGCGGRAILGEDAQLADEELHVALREPRPPAGALLRHRRRAARVAVPASVRSSVMCSGFFTAQAGDSGASWSATRPSPFASNEKDPVRASACPSGSKANATSPASSGARRPRFRTARARHCEERHLARAWRRSGPASGTDHQWHRSPLP